MKKKFLSIIFIAIGMFIISRYSDHNLNKTVAACMLAQQQTSESFNAEKAKKFCKKEIKKLKK